MAIEKTITCQNGIIIENAYIKIDVIGYNNVSKLATMSVNIFKNKTFSDNNKSFVERVYKEFAPNLFNNTSILKQGYEYLKNLEEYKGAIDLLDNY